jgi:hypothetical protein
MTNIEIFLKAFIWIVFACSIIAMIYSIRLRLLMSSFINAYDKSIIKKINYFTKLEISREEVIKEFDLNDNGIKDLDEILKSRKILFKLFLPFILYVLISFLIFILAQIFT